VTTQAPQTRFEDRLLEQLKQVLAEDKLAHEGSAPHARPPHRRRPALAGFAAIAVALAAGVFAVVSSLGGSRPGIAQAAVISRAVAALEQPNTILYLQVQDYSAEGGICVLRGECIFRALPGRGTGISADPAEDTVTYSSQEWVSPDGSEDHTIYNNGVETVRNEETHEYEAYDPADNTVTTLTDFGLAKGPPSRARVPIPATSDFENPTYYENLYREAQAGTQQVQLLGATTIGGTPVYELRFDIEFAPPPHPAAGDMCGSEACTPPDQQILVYLDSQTFTPVRSVMITLNTADRPGLPQGASVTNVTDFVAHRLPDTAANEQLLEMSSHPGATQTRETQAQSKATLGAWMDAQVAANRAARARSSRASRRAAKPGARTRR
jgi:hypothetical protein